MPGFSVIAAPALMVMPPQMITYGIFRSARTSAENRRKENPANEVSGKIDELADGSSLAKRSQFLQWLQRLLSAGHIGPRAVTLVNLLCTTDEPQLPAPQHGHTQLSSR